MHQRLAACQPETVNSRADNIQYVPGVFERRGGRDQVIAPRAEVFAVGAIEVALHRHVIDRNVWVECEIAARDLEQVSQIREHGVDYMTGCAVAG